MDAVSRSLSGSTCLVTGAAGFVGRHLVEALVRRGAKVKALDVVPIPQAGEGVTPIRADITKRDEVDRAMVGVDVVFHTAARVFLVEHAPAKARDSMRAVNVQGTQNLLDAAIAAGATRFVHTSTAGVCFGRKTSGGDESLPYSTHADLYTTTKIEAEKRVLAANGKGSLLTAALRPGGIYGPGERNQLVKPLLEEVKKGEPITTIGDGSSRLDYTFVDNLVEAEIRAAERLVPGLARRGSGVLRLRRTADQPRRVLEAPVRPDGPRGEDAQDPGRPARSRRGRARAALRAPRHARAEGDAHAGPHLRPRLLLLDRESASRARLRAAREHVRRHRPMRRRCARALPDASGGLRTNRLGGVGPTERDERGGALEIDLGVRELPLEIELLCAALPEGHVRVEELRD